MAKRASRMFGLGQIPRIYLRRGYEQTIEIGGLKVPFLVLSSDFLELTAEEDPGLLSGMIAGRIAGIRAGARQGQDAVLDSGTLLGYLPIPALLVKGLEALVNEWNRCRYFTYDRAFLLAKRIMPGPEKLFIQSLPGEILDRFALGSPKDRYAPQAARFWEGLGAEGAIRTLNSLRMDDAWIPERYRELKKFRETMGRDGYDAQFQHEEEKRTAESSDRFCRFPETSRSVSSGLRGSHFFRPASGPEFPGDRPGRNRICMSCTRLRQSGCG